MALTKLQEAITRIRSGDRQTGQRLLTEVLSADPGNETAWLWMSTLVTGEQRRFCLEKVLSINPNHPQAREQLAKLRSVAPPAPTATNVEPTVPSRDAQVDVQSASAVPPVPVQGTPLPKVWLIPRKPLSGILYLEGDILLAFDALSSKAPEVLEEVRFGITPKQFNGIRSKFKLMNVSSFSLAKVTSVTLFGNALEVAGVDKSGREKKINILVNKENSEAILNALHERLGSNFQRITRSVSRLRVLAVFGIVAMISSLGNPPEETVLTRVESPEER